MSVANTLRLPAACHAGIATPGPDETEATEFGWLGSAVIKKRSSKSAHTRCVRALGRGRENELPFLPLVSMRRLPQPVHANGTPSSKGVGRIGAHMGEATDMRGRPEGMHY